MNFIEAAIFILFFTIISVPFATRFRLPLEVFLLIGSCLISLLPWLPTYRIDPQVVFNVFLPPILFYAAYFTSWRDFKRNFRAIGLLAFGLVIVTMIVVAIVAHALFPQLSVAECFLLGAIVSPTDAASATAIIKKFAAPRRLVTILEGESLVNDATALLLFRFALAAILTGGFSFPEFVSQFFIVTLGGIAVGIIVGMVSVLIVQRINNVSAETTLSFITAIMSYIIAEHLGVSGVISTVVCGLFFGIVFPELSSSKTRLNAKSSWDTLIFMINGFAFTLIGLELPVIIKNLSSESLLQLMGQGLLVSIAVIVVRLVWVYVVAYLSRLIPSVARKDPMPSWYVLFILGWCGMRGIVSLAAALSLPFAARFGENNVQHDLILFLTYCVIVVTLILPSFTLPLILKYFNIDDSENKMKQEAHARLSALEGVKQEIEKLHKQGNIPQELLAEARNQIDRRLQVIKTQLIPTPYSTLNREYQALKKLTLSSIESERKTLFKLRKKGNVDDEVFHRLLEELDFEEMRAKTLRI